MAAPSSPRIEAIEIPDRPAVSSEAERRRFTVPRRMLLWGAGSAVVVLLLAIGAMLLTGGGRKEARAPGEVPLIKAEDQPFKVSPDSEGGMQVPNRDIMIYGRLQHDKPGGKTGGRTGDKPAVERLLPEPEKPLTPPEPPPPPEAKPVEAKPGDQPVAEAPPPTEPAPGEPALPPLFAPPAPATPQAKAQAHPAPAAPQPAPSASHAAKPQQKEVASLPKASQPAPAQTARKAPAVKKEEPRAEEKTAKADAKPEEKAAKPPSSGRYQVQLFSGRSPDEAKGAWSKLKGRNGDLLASLSPTVARADLAEKGTFYRLRVGPLDGEAKARALCSSLSGRGVPCIVVRPAG